MKTLVSVTHPGNPSFFKLMGLLDHIGDLFADPRTAQFLRELNFNPSVVKAPLDLVDLYPFGFIVSTLPEIYSPKPEIVARATMIEKAAERPDRKLVVAHGDMIEVAIPIVVRFVADCGDARQTHKEPPTHVSEADRQHFAAHAKQLLAAWNRSAQREEVAK